MGASEVAWWWYWKNEGVNEPDEVVDGRTGEAVNRVTKQTQEKRLDVQGIDWEEEDDEEGEKVDARQEEQKEES